MFGLFEKREKPDQETQEPDVQVQEGSGTPLEMAQSFTSAIMPVVACGAGLFSDGYVNNVCRPAEPSNRLFYSIPFYSISFHSVLFFFIVLHSQTKKKCQG